MFFFSFRTSLFYFSVNAAQTWYLKTTEMCAFTVLGARSSKSRHLYGHAPSKSLRENPSLLLFFFFNFYLFLKDSDAGRDWGQEEKGTTEDEMAGWHH